jgi:hypothetical protein
MYPTNLNHHLKRAEVQEVISSPNPKKSLGNDCIIGKIQQLPIIRIKYRIQLFNTILLKGYFLAQWRVTKVILILKQW